MPQSFVPAASLPSAQAASDNRSAVLRSVALAARPISRSDIARVTGLHQATVSRIAKGLIDSGLVREAQAIETPGKVGRRFIGLQLQADGHLVLGVALNAYEQRVAIATLENRVLDTIDLQFDDITDAGRVVDAIVEAAGTLRRRYARRGAVVYGLAAGVSGVVDRTAGAIVRSPVLGWREVPLGALLARRLRLPVLVMSLPDTVHAAEQAIGVARDSRSSLLVNAALGVGSSLILDGRLVSSEPAHHVLPGDLLVSRLCGAPPGTPLDLVAGGRAVLANNGLGVDSAAALPAGPASVALRRLVKAQAGVSTEGAAFTRVASVLGELSAVMVAAVNPQVLLLAGPLSRVDAFWNAWHDTVLSVLGQGGVSLRRSRIDHVEAATWCAIDRHVLAQPTLNAERPLAAGVRQ
ncbi:MAG: ROK family transcriptional regulator [Burkholderiaceae bacterium]